MSAQPSKAERSELARSPCCEAGRSLRILGVTLDDLAVNEAIDRLREAAHGHSRATLFFANAHTLEWADRDPAFRATLGEGDFVFGDGTGVRWAARLQGVRLRANLNGTDFIPALMRAFDGDGLRVYLLGAPEQVVARAAGILKQRHPGWSVVGAHHGFFDAAASPGIVTAINRAAPHLLLVAMGNPLQERWIAANRDALAVPLVAGVGGLFAYLTGDYRRAPSVMRRFGVEWLYVLFTQRRKWRRYVAGAPRFLLRVLAERLFTRPPP